MLQYICLIVENNANAEMGSSRIIKNFWETKNIEIDCPVPIQEIYKYLLLCDFLRFSFQCIIAISHKKMF